MPGPPAIPVGHIKPTLSHFGSVGIWVNWQENGMNNPGHVNQTGSAVKTFILEDREVYRLFLRHWLGERNGHQVVFFDSPEALQANGDPRDLEFMAAHLLSGRHRPRTNVHAHAHAVYGEGLDGSTILWCRKNGVNALFDLRDRLEEWARCLEGMKKGERVETSSITRRMNGGQVKTLARLSRRENEVARMLVRGHSAKQVAAALGTSEGTVKNQRKAVYRKLGIVRATQLARAMGYRAH